MSNVLKVLGVNFSNNALDQITYDDTTHCTSIVLNTNTLTFETVNETYQLIATVLPADTTDIVEWESSNDEVASVVDGLVTIHGIGSATITATCGSRSATATIEQTTIKSDAVLKVLSAYRTLDNNGNYVIATAVSDCSIIAKAYTNADDLRIGSQDSISADDKVEQIPIPYGATKMKLATVSGNAITLNEVLMCDMDDIYSHQEYPAGLVKYPRYKSKKSSVSGNTGCDVTAGYCFNIWISSSRIASETPSYVYFE